MKLTVTLNTATYEREVELNVGPNNSIPMIVQEACRQVGISYSAVTSFVIVGVQ